LIRISVLASLLAFLTLNPLRANDELEKEAGGIDVGRDIQRFEAALDRTGSGLGESRGLRRASLESRSLLHRRGLGWCLENRNAGVTWTPIFDNEGSYSIGTVVLDPKNPNVVWSAQARTTASEVSAMATASIARKTAARAGKTSA